MARWLAAVVPTLLVVVTLSSVALSVLQLRKHDVTQAGPAFVAPGGIFVPQGAIVLILWVLSSLTAKEMLVTAGFVAVAASSHAMRERLRARNEAPVVSSR